MDIIVTHELADFDALAASVAAQRLYPGSIIVLGQGVSLPVHGFLALHKERFPQRKITEIDQDAVTRIIVVDVRRASRLRAFPRLLERIAAKDPGLLVEIWDHHAPASDDLPANLLHVAEVGSATTLLVEEMQRRGLGVDAIEATLFALGIHSDTGSLCFSTARARDAAALAWLMERGANTRAIERYLDPPLSASQREALVRTLEQTRVRSLAGFRVGFGAIQVAERCPGLDVVTSRARALLGLSAIFLAFERGGRVDAIARSATPFIDVGGVLGVLGGGGHASAASASASGLGAREAIERMESALLEAPLRPRRVTELMSTPVHSVAPDTSLATLADALAAWQHTGVPVLQDGKLVGIVSRRDVDKARARNALHLPVSGWMTHEVRTIDADASVEEALDQMQRHDVGRLPVLRAGDLIGIVTRSDLLEALYES